MLFLSAAIKITKSHLRQEVSTDLFWEDVDYRYKTVVQMSSTSLELSAQNLTWPVLVRLETILKKEQYVQIMCLQTKLNKHI